MKHLFGVSQVDFTSRHSPIMTTSLKVTSVDESSLKPFIINSTLVSTKLKNYKFAAFLQCFLGVK